MRQKNAKSYEEILNCLFQWIKIPKGAKSEEIFEHEMYGEPMSKINGEIDKEARYQQWKSKAVKNWAVLNFHKSEFWQQNFFSKHSTKFWINSKSNDCTSTLTQKEFPI
jgi:hypothetical protein